MESHSLEHAHPVILETWRYVQQSKSSSFGRLAVAIFGFFYRPRTWHHLAWIQTLTDPAFVLRVQFNLWETQSQQERQECERSNSVSQWMFFNFHCSSGWGNFNTPLYLTIINNYLLLFCGLCFVLFFVFLCMRERLKISKRHRVNFKCVVHSNYSIFFQFVHWTGLDLIWTFALDLVG